MLYTNFKNPIFARSERLRKELNIMIDLWLGHDMIFNAESNVPVNPLVVKNSVLSHKTLDEFK
jgi:uncharacterized metal-binding protein